MVLIDLRTFYRDTVRLADFPEYLAEARGLAGEGREVVITGQAPV